VSADDLVAQVRSVVDPLLADGVPDDLLEVDLYNSGSFFNDDEVPADARGPVLESLGRLSPLKLVLIESRPEYVTESTVRAAFKALNRHRPEPCRLQIGIGLEAVTQQIRNGLIRKGFGLKDYERAAAAVDRAGAELLTYVLLKPLGMEEAPAVEEAVRTIEYVFATAESADARVRASLEPVLVLADTALAEVYREGGYRPPSLWSVIEVIRRTADLGDLRVGVSDEGMHTLAAPRGCDQCTAPLRRAIREFDATGHRSILESLDCTCRPAG
jgi:radical SAM enzyme (TIGR01210 family)